MPLDSQPTCVWEPQPGPQTALVCCPVFEVFYGGARGGGKTDGVLGDWISHADLFGVNAIGLMVRRTRTELVETIERSKALFRPLGAVYHEQQSMWTMPGGARLRFAYLERDADADNYQGHSYTRVYVEEAGNFPSSTPILKLMATLRSGAGVPCGMRLTGNPGGPGHQWVKARYIDPDPLGWTIITSEFTDPFTGETVSLDRVFIPSSLRDNRYLGGKYVAGLQMSGSPELVRAWLEGDWSVIAGAFFPEFGAAHIVRAHELPKHWTRFRSMDWGSARPFSVGWWAVSDGTIAAYPRGALIRYREWYGMKEGQPNVGLKLHAEEVGKGIAMREAGDDIAYGVIDPAAFAENGGPSIGERIMKGSGTTPNGLNYLVSFRPADNTRVGKLGAMGGWDQFRARLVGEDGRPMAYVFDNCRDSIRTIPALQHDADRAEDVDTEGEDHAADDWRYGFLSRPMTTDAPNMPKPRFREFTGVNGSGAMTGGETFNERIERLSRRRREADG
jgi:hypothetical protein